MQADAWLGEVPRVTRKSFVSLELRSTLPNIKTLKEVMEAASTQSSNGALPVQIKVHDRTIQRGPKNRCSSLPPCIGIGVRPHPCIIGAATPNLTDSCTS